jgi:hypothetical protein
MKGRMLGQRAAEAQGYIPAYFQPSLAGLMAVGMYTQD